MECSKRRIFWLIWSYGIIWTQFIPKPEAGLGVACSISSSLDGFYWAIIRLILLPDVYKNKPEVKRQQKF